MDNETQLFSHKTSEKFWFSSGSSIFALDYMIVIILSSAIRPVLDFVAVTLAIHCRVEIYSHGGVGPTSANIDADSAALRQMLVGTGGRAYGLLEPRPCSRIAGLALESSIRRHDSSSRIRHSRLQLSKATATDTRRSVARGKNWLVHAGGRQPVRDPGHPLSSYFPSRCRRPENHCCDPRRTNSS